MRGPAYPKAPYISALEITSAAVAAGPTGFIRSLSAAPQPLVALPSFLFVDTFFQLLPLALGFAAGCMLWMVFAELLPDALNDAKHSKVSWNRTQLALQQPVIIMQGSLLFIHKNFSQRVICMDKRLHPYLHPSTT